MLKKIKIDQIVPLSCSVLTNLSSIVAADMLPRQVIPNIIVKVMIDEYCSSIYIYFSIKIYVQNKNLRNGLNEIQSITYQSQKCYC